MKSSAPSLGPTRGSWSTCPSRHLRTAALPRELIDEHLGTDSSTIPVVANTFLAYEHVNAQVAMTAFLEQEGRNHRLVGLTGQQRHHATLSDMLESAHMMGVKIGAPDLVTLPTGPTTSLDCVQFGLFLIDDRGTPLAILVRGPSERSDMQGVNLEVVSANREHSSSVIREVAELMAERNVFRGQVIAFGEAQMGHRGIGALVFYSRPQMSAQELVLPEKVIGSIERQVLGVAGTRDRLRASGQHVKRGLLLYGPPGTGKTHTVRYLMSRTPDHTVILITGGALHMIRPAVGLARVLQPCLVVCEDVDLVAQDRGMYPGPSNPALFDMLNVIDGIEEDADVAFILTTNRADLLEPALAARPGRVDLALEIPLPDAGSRRRLIELYGGGLALQMDHVETVIERTDGVTASFIKELMRKSALVAALDEPGEGTISLGDAQVIRALDELLDEENELTQVLLGRPRPGAPTDAPAPGTGWMYRRLSPGE